MPDRYHPWKRFWVRQGGTYRLSSEGYLLDPESDYGRRANPDVKPFDTISEQPCLALLGDPGIGKTDILGRIVDQRRAALGPRQILAINLRSYSNDARLYNALFESREFAEWVNASHTLEIFLDSLDECLIHNRAVAALLVDEFRKYPVDRLRLRIACRAAEWPDLLAAELPTIWGRAQYDAFELVPLRRNDVADLARAYKIDSEAFLAQVARQEAAALASVPITLNLLLTLFTRDGSLPASRIELYTKGCLALCRESSLSRKAATGDGGLSPHERLSLSERVAAVTLFSRRACIGVEDNTPDDASFAGPAELVASPDVLDGRQYQWSAGHLREALGTALFTSLSSQTRIWMHWTLAEFLAARWAITRGLTVQQIGALIFRADLDAKEVVTPQLHETAAWLAAMNADVMEEIIRRDPKVLLRSTIANSDLGTRGRIVTSLLRAFDEERAIDYVDLRQRYEVLANPDLHAQLLPYIADRAKNVVVRRAAIDIAEACNESSIIGLLPAIALDRSENRQIRSQAAHAVCRAGTPEAKVMLRPLLDTTPEEDPDEELRGNALRAVFDELTGEELFRHATHPRRPNFLGAYRYFWEYEMPELLRTTDVPAALQWVAAQPPDIDVDLGFQRVIEAILERGWEDLHDAKVCEALAYATVARLGHHEPPLDRIGTRDAGKRAASDAERRWLLLTAVVPKLRGEGNRYGVVGLVQAGLVQGSDIPRLTEKLEGACAEDKESWAQLIAYVYDVTAADHYDLILNAMNGSSELRKQIGWLLDVVDLDSPRAAKLRADYAQQQRWHRRAEKPKVERAPMSQIVENWLRKFQAGDLSAWWRLNLDLTLASDDDRYGDEMESDLTTLPGWQEIDDDLRKGCIGAAKRYVREADPKTSEWLGTNTFHRPAAAGYRALRLMLSEDRNALTQLALEDWRTWAPIVIAYPESLKDRQGDEGTELVALAYLMAPEIVIETVRALIHKENADHGTVFITRRLVGCWDSRLTGALLHTVRWGYELKPPALHAILSEVLRQDDLDAVDYALSLVAEPRVVPEIRVQVGVAILDSIPGRVWDRLQPLIDADRSFFRQVFLKFAHQAGIWHGQGIAPQLTEKAVADLYLWLTSEFAHADDPTHDGPLAHYVDEREAVASLRDGLLRYLTEKGTAEAVSEVRRIASHLAVDLPWLKYVALTADATRLRKVWDGISPEALFRLARNTQARIVEDEGQLLRVVCESLERVQIKLHGTPPAVDDLWNDDGTPTDEMRLSNYITRHLQSDLGSEAGMVANREVRIRPGEATDIYVTVMRKDLRSAKFEQMTVIVEVKGCWNDNLRTDMENQLKKRYLLENQCRHGLYLVGWFRCPKWNQEDYRLAKTPKMTLAEARTFFSAQADQLSDSMAVLRAFVLDAAQR